MNINLPINVKGHLLIKDDLGNILLDKQNAVHPQNMARVIARALANEHNFFINEMAFGNAGTVVDAAFQITYKTPNDGQAPDPAGWESRLYNETYAEIVNDSSLLIGTGLGAVPAGDPSSVEHVSGPGVRSSEGPIFSSQTLVEVVLNPGEPRGQFLTDVQGPVEDTESDFTFDEIGLFSSGAPHVATAGFQNVDVSNKTVASDTGLATNSTYVFNIKVDGGVIQNISITTPLTGSGIGGEILYSDLLTLINTQVTGAVASISNPSLSINTFGFLKFSSLTTGAASSILLSQPGAGSFLFTNLAGFITPLLTPVPGFDQGIQNDPVNFTRERERMLTHIIFSPVLKSSNRSLTILYTLTVSVARNV